MKRLAFRHWKVFLQRPTINQDFYLALWRKWEQALHNRRATSWMRGVKAAIGLEEHTGEEIAEEEVCGDVLCLRLIR